MKAYDRCHLRLVALIHMATDAKKPKNSRIAKTFPTAHCTGGEPLDPTVVPKRIDTKRTKQV